MYASKIGRSCSVSGTAKSVAWTVAATIALIFVISAFSGVSVSPKIHTAASIATSNGNSSSSTACSAAACGSPPLNATTGGSDVSCSSSAQCPLPLIPPAKGLASHPVTTGVHPATYSGHYWIGATYSGSATTATYVYTTIGTPSSAPRYNDVYYELLSAWDSNGNYDQIGLASFYCSTTLYSSCSNSDNWFIIYSQGTVSSPGCTITYHTTITSATVYLGIYSDYTFGMTLTGVHLAFDVYAGSSFGGTNVLGVAIADTASNFAIASTYTCEGSSEPDFQVYEEVYDISNTMSAPQWNSGFANTYYGSTDNNQWTTYISTSAPTCPHGSWIDYANSNTFVRVDNVAFWINMAYDAQTIARGNSNSISGSINADGTYCSGTTCPFTASCTYPTGYTSGSYSPPGSSGYVPVSSTTYSVTIGSSATTGLYTSGCTVTVTSTTPNEYSTFLVYTTIT